MWNGVSTRLHARSLTLLGTLEARLPRMMTAWLVLALVASAVRIALSPLHGIVPGAATILPYALLVVAPLASLGLALHWFEKGDCLPQPRVRLARVGRWTQVAPNEARRHRLYGTSGIMVSLLVGMLLNVPVRALEYWAAMPALVGPVPGWLTTLHFMMTLDVVLLSSLYVVAFAAALRRVPLFPRLLAVIWLVDLSMQVSIAQVVSASPDLPETVAGALRMLLEGNVKKVLISIGLWLPYLLLSTRVNVTFRHRIPAA